MSVKNTIKILTLFALCSIIIAPGVAAQNPEEWFKLVDESLPPEVGDPDFTQDLMNPKIEPQLSENWDLRRAFAAFEDKLGPVRENFFATIPQGNPDEPVEDQMYVRGDPTGEFAASMMKFNLGEGLVKYMNRGRQPDANGPEQKVTPDEALGRAQEIAALVGIPMNELAPKANTQVRELFVTGAPNKGEVRADEVIRKRMEVLVMIPRCMQTEKVECVPVVNSGLRTALVDGSRGPSAGWFRTNWPDFKIAKVSEMNSRSAVVGEISRIMAEKAEFGSIQKLIIEVAYAQNQELAGENGSINCPSTAEGADEPGPEDPQSAALEPPPGVQIARQFLPAVLVYALPVEFDEVDPKQGTFSTGIHVFSVPLVKAPPAECEAGERQ